MQEMPVHGDQRPVGKNELRALSEFLDEAENVIPAPAVQARGVFAQLPQDFIHLEAARMVSIRTVARMVPCGIDRSILRENEHVVPQPGFQMALHFGQIEIRTCSAFQKLRRIVEEEQPEIEQRRRNRLPSTSTCFSTRCQPRGRTIKVAVFSASSYFLPSGLTRRMLRFTASRRLICPSTTFGPGGRVRILEIGHENVGAGVQAH